MISTSCVDPYVVLVDFDEKFSDGSFHKSPRWIEVPCRKCLGCRQLKSREWSFRLRNELAVSDGVFITLTYDDVHLPLSDSGYFTLCKKHLQDFVKRFRWKFRSIKFKYYSCGEYGELGLRPHYHLAMFGMPYACYRPHTYVSGDKSRFYSEVVFSLWRYGFNNISDLTASRCVYICDYMNKNFLYHYPKGVVKPFNTMSKGLGLQFFKDNKDSFIKYPNQLDSEGNVIHVPHYLVSKWKKEMSVEERIAYNDRLYSGIDKEGSLFPGMIGPFTPAFDKQKEALRLSKVVELRRSVESERMLRRQSKLSKKPSDL